MKSWTEVNWPERIPVTGEINAVRISECLDWIQLDQARVPWQYRQIRSADMKTWEASTESKYSPVEINKIFVE
jgi:hypothetical protein